MSVALVVLVVVVLLLLSMAVRIVQEYERGVVFRLGRVLPAPKGPGLVFIIPVIDRMRKVPLRVTTLDIPPQDIITRDNVTLQVNGVCYFRVQETLRAVVEVQDYRAATFQIAQTTLRAVLCRVHFDEILTERDQLNLEIREIIDAITDPWGIKVTGLEIRDINLPDHVERVMARQAEAERERRGKIIAAEGEFQASERLAEAAEVLGRHAIAYQLRFLQTISAVAAEKNRTILVPLPTEILVFGARRAALGPNEKRP